MIRRPTILALATLALAACSPSADADGAGGSGGGGSGGTGGTGGTGGEQPRACVSTSQCPGDEVCDPVARTCTAAPISCEGHAACGAAAYCADGGVCAPNTTGGPCVDDTGCPPGESCTGGFCGCEGDQFTAEAVPPNVLIMLDKSGSMDDEVGGTAKWDIAVDAVEKLLTDFGDNVRFGLVLYPSGDECSPGNVRVDVGDGTATEILAALASTGPNGKTPIGASLQGAVDYAGLEDAARSNYVLLLTDGDETCGGDGEDAVTELRGKTPEVKTFVVGFGGEVDADELNAMAVAGGTEQAGSTKYYQADDAASLASAFADIGGEVLSCSYQLSGEATSASELFIYFDGTAVPHDPSHAAGWDYDPDTNQVTFHGADCEALRGGTVEDLVIVHGCPMVIG